MISSVGAYELNEVEGNEHELGDKVNLLVAQVVVFGLMGIYAPKNCLCSCLTSSTYEYISN